MTSPMPRDSLGRIVYAGDVVEDGAIVYLVKSGNVRMMRQGDFFDAEAEKLIIDLSASPCLTNYERYFADLGTREEVADAADSCLGDESRTCELCPLAGWGKAFGSHPFGCVYFNRWLIERAVI